MVAEISPIALAMKLRFALPLALLLLLSACEKPERRAAPETAVETPAPPPVAEAVPSAEPSAPPVDERPAAPAPPAEEKAPEHPELYVSIDGDKLIVRGALTSRIQQERIIETLKREFPDLELVDELKLEHHRHPVAWGNRLADPFLVRYLREVNDPVVSYKDGIVTLEGRPKGSASVQSLTEMAIETFSGDRTEDLVNKLGGI